MQIRDLIPWGRDKNEVAHKTDGGDGQLADLQRSVNRVFDDFWSRFDRSFGGSGGFLNVPNPIMDISDDDDEVVISAELPGIDEKDIDVSMTRDTLTVKGEKRAESEENNKGYYLSERSYGSFYRSVPLPQGVDTDKARAEFRKGVLKISLPKTPGAKAEVKRIKVNAA